MQELRGSDERRTEFARRMRAARQYAQMSQKAASEAIGISQPTLSQLEKRATKSAHTAKAAQAYRVSAVWLQTGAGGMLDGSSNLSERAAYIAAQLDAIKNRAMFEQACILCESFAALAQAGHLPTSEELVARASLALWPSASPQPGHKPHIGGAQPKPA